MMDFEYIIHLGIISAFLLVGAFLRTRVRFLQRFLIPSSIIAGALMLIFYNYIARHAIPFFHCLFFLLLFDFLQGGYHRLRTPLSRCRFLACADASRRNQRNPHRHLPLIQPPPIHPPRRPCEQPVHRLVKLSEWNQLNPLHLESAMLQFIAILIQDMDSPKESAFTKQLNYGKIRVGNQRFIHLTAHDIKAIQEAHDILSKNIASPPTIEMLSKQLLINTQKLKAGFVHYYHMTIGEFSTTLKMSMASTLLCTTDKSVAEIAQEVGYPYPSNFIKKFQQTYSCTPLKYRQRKNDKR